jgi:hypothetical protein
MTDFRALCAEMIFIWSKSTNPDDLFENMIPLVDRTKTALDEKPVVPTGEEIIAFWSDHCAGAMFDVENTVNRWGHS